MTTTRLRRLRPLPLLLLAGVLGAAWPGPAAAGPLVRRAQERRACQEFAGKLQQASGNPAMAQQVYQQGVLQLVQRFGENPCGDIPAPTASTAPAMPATGAAAATPPAATTPPVSATTAPTGAASPGAGTNPAGPTTAGGTSATTGSPTTPAASAQQQQACQQFAGKLQAAASSGGAAAAQQTYAMGLQKLTGMFGSNPCPTVRPPQ